MEENCQTLNHLLKNNNNNDDNSTVSTTAIPIINKYVVSENEDKDNNCYNEIKEINKINNNNQTKMLLDYIGKADCNDVGDKRELVEYLVMVHRSRAWIPQSSMMIHQTDEINHWSSSSILGKRKQFEETVNLDENQEIQEEEKEIVNFGELLYTEFDDVEVEDEGEECYEEGEEEEEKEKEEEEEDDDDEDEFSFEIEYLPATIQSNMLATDIRFTRIDGKEDDEPIIFKNKQQLQEFVCHQELRTFLIRSQRIISDRLVGTDNKKFRLHLGSVSPSSVDEFLMGHNPDRIAKTTMKYYISKNKYLPPLNTAHYQMTFDLQKEKDSKGKEIIHKYTHQYTKAVFRSFIQIEQVVVDLEIFESFGNDCYFVWVERVVAIVKVELHIQVVAPCAMEEYSNSIDIASVMCSLLGEVESVDIPLHYVVGPVENQLAKQWVRGWENPGGIVTLLPNGAFVTTT
ncbi:hypothetical protein DFA_01885 [Cavenderia fasciculata]|uniref:Uncharacterized protein n=1 Tax=Cavenderia fasciculata TaxID=261658 RepID=F4PV89_CACFS|nr:uncharacterized protein DFA_01885 [Cavenderia fasciculata]EGG21997.1 hypothetical protein DFA_01885 [Cavenderia fasciculata]|eukprot:XP_004359848.1 hypothetical protein DFA_01885 [Cavenderia fasciculata]